MQFLIHQTSAAGDERSSRNPAVREKARKQHIANAAEWLRRFRTEQPEGASASAIAAAYRRECKLANISPVI